MGTMRLLPLAPLNTIYIGSKYTKNTVCILRFYNHNTVMRNNTYRKYHRQQHSIIIFTKLNLNLTNTSRDHKAPTPASACLAVQTPP